jgi:two-component system response regulator RegA
MFGRDPAVSAREPNTPAGFLHGRRGASAVAPYDRVAPGLARARERHVAGLARTTAEKEAAFQFRTGRTEHSPMSAHLLLRSQAITSTGRSDVLLVDSDDRWVISVSAALFARSCDVRACRDMRTARALVDARPPDIVAVELRVADGPSLALIEWIKSARPEVRVVVETSHDSVASAVKCARLGVEAYLVKPFPPEELISAACCPNPDPGLREVQTKSLDRARWEYVNQVLEFAGSIAGAADLLGVDRRSLRRMLSKNAPRDHARNFDKR